MVLLAHGAQRGEVGAQSVKRELEDRHRAGHVSKLMASEIDEREPARRHRRIVCDVIGHHDLASVRHRHHPGAPVQRRPEEVAADLDRRTPMDAHAHPQRFDLRRLDVGEPVLGLIGGRQSVGGSVEHSEHAVTGVRHDRTPVARDCRGR